MRRAAIAALALAMAACKPAPAPAPKVTLAGHDAFFLWPGVRPPPELKRARTLYLLDGEVRRGDPPRLTVLRPAAPRLPRQDVWLVVRLETLDWPPALADAVIAELARWRAAGSNIVGLQLDFDAGTKGLDRYAGFLRGVKARLPAGTQLSVTGLMDWSAHGDPAALAALGGAVDEVVIQTYQGRRTIPGYEGYLAGLARLPMPYRVALVQGGEWREPANLKTDPRYRGTVVYVTGKNGPGFQPRSR